MVAATVAVQVNAWLPRSALDHPPAELRDVCQLLNTSVTITVTHQHPDHGWVYTTVTLHAHHWPKQNHTDQQVVMAAVGAHGQLLGAGHAWVFPNEPRDRTSMIWPRGTRRLVAYWQPNVR